MATKFTDYENELNRIQWFVVEVKTADNKKEFYFIHRAACINVSFCDEDVTFKYNKVNLIGRIRYAGDDRELTETKLKNMREYYEEHKDTQVWAMVRVLTGNNKVHLIAVDSKNLTCIENTRQYFVLRHGDTDIPVQVCYFFDSEDAVFEKMTCFYQWMISEFHNEEEDEKVKTAGMENALLFVVHQKTRNEMVFEIIKYTETENKVENTHPDIVAYVRTSPTSVSQALILSKSLDLEYLTEHLSLTQMYADNLDFNFLCSPINSASSPSPPENQPKPAASKPVRKRKPRAK